MPIEESITLIGRLTPGSYTTHIGNITSPEYVEKFVKNVKERVPELAGKEEDEVESEVLNALSEVTDEACKLIDKWEKWGVSGGVHDKVSLYECYHPSTGKFYISVLDWGDFSAGEGGISFFLTRDKGEARKDFRDTVKALKMR